MLPSGALPLRDADNLRCWTFRPHAPTSLPGGLLFLQNILDAAGRESGNYERKFELDESSKRTKQKSRSGSYRRPRALDRGRFCKASFESR